MRISDWSSDVCSSDLGDLLVRAGFALPVADTETLTVRYRDLFGLLRDLRGMAATSLLPDPAALSRDTLARAAALFAERAAGDGRTAERFDIIDRKSVVLGKSVSVRVDLGGRRHMKKNKK